MSTITYNPITIKQTVELDYANLKVSKLIDELSKNKKVLDKYLKKINSHNSKQNLYSMFNLTRIKSIKTSLDKEYADLLLGFTISTAIVDVFDCRVRSAIIERDNLAIKFSKNY